eukprot:2890680-Prymnesium_polylepis.1
MRSASTAAPTCRRITAARRMLCRRCCDPTAPCGRWCGASMVRRPWMSTRGLSWSSTRPLITRGGSLVRTAWVTRAATMLRACAA